MTQEEAYRLMAQRQQDAMPMRLLNMGMMQQTSTFNYRKFSKPQQYDKAELRQMITTLAENGYIRRVK